ncbi:hypothetical protein [Dietzia massiliensis]|uniref:hypothetical protein n=1 Tax=Dietzia massiliensis TaxID=2697499 RepID=UPI001BCD458B|nr:hypothetical protein [Dietzia massiliensis]MBS7547516.1 hypothetical protein [Dietzia massiliensis]
MPHSAPVVLSRRRFVGAAVCVTGFAVAGGCALPAVVDRPDPLIPLIDAATRDARELAAADATHGDRVGALRRIADARRMHADALAGLTDTADEGEGEEQPATPAPPPVCPPVDEVRARLRADAALAADVAAEIDGARAEIAGAVSAACTAAAEVVLA